MPTIELTRSLLPKNINVVARLSATPCWVNADHEQMERTLINLVLNARDAMLEGGKLVISISHTLFETMILAYMATFLLELTR